MAGCRIARFPVACPAGRAINGRIVNPSVVLLDNKKAMLRHSMTLYGHKASRYLLSMITPTHIRTARAALGWGLRELAAKAGTGIKSVWRFENGDDVRKSTVDKWQRTLESEGVTFENSSRPGIHWPAT